MLAAVAAPSGLIAWWPGEGDAVDVAGNNDGTLQNGATYAAGKVGQAFSLDGVNDYVRVPSSAALNPTAGFTIEAWIDSSSTSGARVIVSKWDDGTGDWSYIFKDHNYSDQLRIELSGSVHNDLADLAGASSIVTGNWIHVAATYDTTTVRLYFNGVLDGEQTVGPNRFIDSSAADLLLGAVLTWGGVSENFAGLIDEVSLYNRALSATEIQSISQAGSDGKYLAMAVNGFTSSPAVGAVVSVPPTNFVMDFTHAYDLGSVAAVDLTVNGLPADFFVATDSDTVTFHYVFSPVLAEGPQTMHIAAGAVTTSDPTPAGPNLLPFDDVFFYDTLRLQVAATSPAAGTVLTCVSAPGTLVVDFNEPIKASSVGTDDLVLSAGSVLTAVVLGNNTVEYTITCPREGNLTVYLPEGAVTDTDGNPVAAFRPNYVADINIVPFTATIAAAVPAGSLVHQGTRSASFQSTGGEAGDIDQFTLAVDGNQTLALSVNSLTATVTLSHSDVGILPLTVVSSGSVTSGNLRQYQAVAIPAPGTLTITVQAATGSTTGSYQLTARLNAQIDTGVDGNVAPQSLAISTLDVDPGATVLSRAAVAGNIQRSAARILKETEGIDTDLRGSWDRVGVTTTWTVNNSGNSNTGLNKGVAGALNKTGSAVSSKYDASDVFVFDGRAGDVLSLRTRGSNSSGGTLSKTSLTLTHPNGTQTLGSAVSGAASDAAITSLALTQNGRYSITVGTDTGKKGTYTLLADLVTSTNPRPNTADVYDLAVSAAGYVSLAAATGTAIVGTAKVGLALYAPGVDLITGTPLATSSVKGTLDGWLEYSATSTGTYKVKVTPGSGLTSESTAYTLVTTSGGVFDDTDNANVTTAQDLTGRQDVQGAIVASTGTFDYYKVSLDAGKKLTVTSSTPGDGAGFIQNVLNPGLELLDASQIVVSTGALLADGRNEQLVFTAPATDTYYIRLSGEVSSTGEYVLNNLVTSDPPPLTAASLPVQGTREAITQAQLQPLLAEAVRRWQLAGASTTALAGVNVQVADLSGATLGQAAGNTIWLDRNAAGWGWFVDPTPGDDLEFLRAGNQGEQHRMDLLTVVMHELGHVLGRDHDTDGVMAETLAAGVRLTDWEHDHVATLDQVFAQSDDDRADAWLGL